MPVAGIRTFFDTPQRLCGDTTRGQLRSYNKKATCSILLQVAFFVTPQRLELWAR